MQTSVAQRQQSAGGSTGVSMIAKEFHKGYPIAGLPYQTGGILVKLLWPSKNQILRIVPGYDPSTGEVYHQNIKCDSYVQSPVYTDYMSDTFFAATVLTKFGTINTPFITDYAPDSPEFREYGGNTVIRHFVRTIIGSVQNNGRGYGRLKPIPEWKGWASIGPTSMLSYPRTSLLMQALIFNINGRNNRAMDSDADLVGEDGNILPLYALVVLDNKASQDELCKALVSPIDPRKPLDAVTNNVLGGVAELDGSLLYLNSGKDQSGRHNVLSPECAAPGQGWDRTPMPLTAEFVKAVWQPWSKLLHYMTLEEQLRLCAQQFGPDTVNYVFGREAMFSRMPIPEDIRAAGLGRYAEGGSGRASLYQQPAPAPGLGFSMPKAAGDQLEGLTPFDSPAPAMPAFSMPGVTPAAASVPAPAATPSFGIPAVAPVPAAAPASSPAVAPAVPSLGVPAAAPAVKAQRPAGLNGLRTPLVSSVSTASTVDQDALQERLKMIQKATSAPAIDYEQQSRDASELLDPEDGQEG